MLRPSAGRGAEKAEELRGFLCCWKGFDAGVGGLRGARGALVIVRGRGLGA